MSLAADSLLSEQQERYARVLLAELQKNSSQYEFLWSQIGLDALDNAPSSIWHKIVNGSYDPDRGDLLAWLRTVLKRLLLDQGRRTLCRKGHEILVSPVANGRGTPLTRAAGRENVELAVRENEMRQFLCIPFPADDLRFVQTWCQYDRVLLLCLAGLWRKVPAQLWDSWAAESVAERGWPSSVLLDFLHAAQSREERTAILAYELSQPRNNLNQHWSRKKHLVESLRCIRELDTAST